MAMASEFGFWMRFIAGILAAYGVGLAKERIDALSQKPAWPLAYSGKPDKLDITATVLGGIPAALLASTVFALFT